MSLSKEVDWVMWLIAEGGRVCQKDPSERKEEGKGQSSEVSSPMHRRLWLLGHLQLQASNVPPAF